MLSDGKVRVLKNKKKKIENQSPYMFRFSYLNVGAKGRRFIRPDLQTALQFQGKALTPSLYVRLQL